MAKFGGGNVEQLGVVRLVERFEKQVSDRFLK